MKKAIISLILLLITATIFTSGCETKTANQTWGEKKINMTLIELSDNITADHFDADGTSFFYVDGYLLNKNPYDALDLKLKATFYDSQGNVFAVNDTVYIEPKVIASNGASYFYFEIWDPEKKIVNYRVEVIDAQGQYGY